MSDQKLAPPMRVKDEAGRTSNGNSAALSPAAPRQKRSLPQDTPSPNAKGDTKRRAVATPSSPAAARPVPPPHADPAIMIKAECAHPPPSPAFAGQAPYNYPPGIVPPPFGVPYQYGPREFPLPMPVTHPMPGMMPAASFPLMGHPPVALPKLYQAYHQVLAAGYAVPPPAQPVPPNAGAPRPATPIRIDASSSPLPMTTRLSAAVHPNAAPAPAPMQPNAAPARPPAAAAATVAVAANGAAPNASLTVNDYLLKTPEINTESDDEFLMECARVRTNIVGIQNYYGFVEEGDDVVLLRDPENQFDPHAIRVDNVLEIQVGFLPASVAKVLGPLIEGNRIQTQAKAIGEPTATTLPIEIRVFTPPGNNDTIRMCLEQFDLLPRPRQTRPGRTPASANIKVPITGAGTGAFPENVVAAFQPAPFQPAAVPAPIPPPPSLVVDLAATAEEMWQQLLQAGDYDEGGGRVIMDSIGMKEQELSALPEAPQPTGMMSDLLPYQKQGLGWLLNAEHPRTPSATVESQFWTIRDINGAHVFWNRASRAQAQGVPRLYRGGILADDMGLGKTIQILALILSDPNGAGFVTEPGEVSPSYCNATLIVCPLSVVGNWTQQIEAHVESGRLRYHVFHGNNRNKDPRYLQSMDIVITTYSIMSLHTEDTPLHRVRWRRVVLDEGHIIRVRTTKNASAACNLIAERKWVLTGTPLHNKLEDLYSLLRFLEFFPFDQLQQWKSTIERPLKQKRRDAMSTFQELVRMLCLRRTKAMELSGKPILELPKITYLVHKVAFRGEERRLYVKWEAKSRQAYEEYMREQAERKALREAGFDVGPGDNLRVICNMLKYLTRLRQLCNHRALVEKENAPKVGSKTQLLAFLRDHVADDCALCLSAMRTPAITACTHLFCSECIRPVLDKVKACPQCQAPLEENQVYDLPQDTEGDEVAVVEREMAAPGHMHFTTTDFLSSSKIDALMTFLETARTRDSTTKSVIFSQWTSMMDLIEVPLRQRGFQFVRLDGTLTRRDRDEAIDQFQSDNTISVFLISLACGATGLNLVAATNCFLVEPWWNPQIERQAIDRIYRIGQTRPVTVVRFAMENSVEERVLLLQEKKRKMAEDAFGEGSTQNNKVSRATRLEDIRALLGEASADDQRLAAELDEL
ncbi:hypothetical protein AMAG_01895 [Allomyces macrogynus ATCC 38327]|uniref:Uncharacterized protein n=1 Tax=Allomyces macrogynus (strain ATCC 38327) TaxID=578462 RepID=A0A0L0S0B0_ALLM3|nr:hypothetical protein AMAG_01895 [Allomyces macrogynus ATCC 38327]|eukprot:KNE56052.1 hypothetical protein AMAG_01895 [Allomyces macrogynus ATCC 38327]